VPFVTVQGTVVPIVVEDIVTVDNNRYTISVTSQNCRKVGALI